MEPVTLIKFDFTKKEDVLKAYQLSAEHALNQTIPIVNIKGVLSGANGARLLAELELRYQMFKMKAKKEAFPTSIPLLETTP